MKGAKIAEMASEQMISRLVAFSVLASIAWAQPAGGVRGRVLDAGTGEPLARVQVQIAGTTLRTTTEGDGAFQLSGLDAGDYVLSVSTVGYYLLRQNFTVTAGAVREFEVVLTPSTQRRTDTVEVKAEAFDLERQESPAAVSLVGNEAKNLASVLSDDPLRAVQGLPGVTSNNDFNSEFTLRGADFHRIGVFLDGVLLHNPFHMVEGQGTQGSLTVFNGDMLDAMTLYEGAWPVRYNDRTAGVLDVSTRDGSKDIAVRLSVGMTNTSLFAEGPLALGKKQRLTWMVDFRKSYLQYLLDHIKTNLPALVFGFTDAQGKLTYTLSSRHTISLSIIDGESALDRSSAQQTLGINQLMRSDFHITLANLTEKYAAGERFLVTSHVAWTRERGSSSNPTGVSLGADGYGEWMGRSDASWIWAAGSTLSFGGLVQRLRDDGNSYQYHLNPYTLVTLDQYRGTATRHSAYLQQSWSASKGRVTFTAGTRYDHTNVTGGYVVSPFTSLSLQPLAGTRVQLGWGQYGQFPDLAQSYSIFGSRGLLPERAIHYEGAIEQNLDDKTRVRFEYYDRQDRDLLWRPLFDPRLLLNGKVFTAPNSAPTVNSQRGYSRGFQVFLQRRTANGLTGWISYAYGVAKVTDGVLHLTFPTDNDQRHTVNVFGSYRLKPTVNLSVKASYGSGFPIPGFYRVTPQGYSLSVNRNQVRLPSYQRIDFRINKALVHDKWKVTLYGEVVNLLNHDNRRFDAFDGYNSSGQAFPTFYDMFPILPSVGLVFEK